MFKGFRRIREKADVIILIIMILLVILGLAVLASASSSVSLDHFGHPYFYLQRQFIFIITAGLAGFLAGRFIPIRWLKTASFPLLLVNLGLLVLVLTPLGGDFGTSNRWIEIAGIPFQPSELLKITFIIYLANWMTSKGKDRKNFAEGLLPFLILCGIVGGLLIAQPSTSILVILLLSAGIVYFMGGLRFSFLAAIMGIAAIALGIIITMTPYRMARITTFMHPESDPQKSGWHLSQSLMTIGSGGVFGVGYGNSVLKNSLPEPMNDTVFAIIAEEFGFVGSMFFIFLYFLLVIAGFLGSLQTRGVFGKLMLIGFSAVIGIQTFIHIASVSGLMPMTGMPLPFVSYGGTGIIALITIGGLMINILKHE